MVLRTNADVSSAFDDMTYVETRKHHAMDQFARTQLIFGPDGMDALAQARVAVFGLGGVGSHAAEALARSGIGTLDVIDHDVVSITNLNRQSIATLSSVGRPKVEVMAERIADINPHCQVHPHQCFYLPASKDEIDLASFDYVIDCIDTTTGKLLIIEEAQRVGTPVISCMGTANKLDPTAFEVADIYDTHICPLAKIIRKECRKRGVKALKVVYSTEPTVDLYEDTSGEPCTRRSGIPGSNAFVPPVAGLIAAAEVVRDLVGRPR